MKHTHVENKEKLTIEMQEKAKKLYENHDALDEFFFYTLNNFSYRYFDTPSAKGESAYKTGQTYVVTSLETSLVEALRCQNKESKKQLIEFAKNCNIKENPCVQSILSSTLSNFTGASGDIVVTAELNWDFPTFSSNENKKIVKRVKHSFEDILELRNKYAKYLEDVCEIF